MPGDTILGYPDDLKFHSSMPLFAITPPEETVVRAALEKFWGGEQVPATLALLNGNRGRNAWSDI